MSEYSALVHWRRAEGEHFVDHQYSRGHEWVFDGGTRVPASSSPHVVRIPFSVTEAVDPEEAFVASLSSCHMLFFLSLAAKAGFVVDEYQDQAVGVLARDQGGHLSMTQVTLNPRITVSGRVPSGQELEQLHHAAHKECFIANSVKTQVSITVLEPVST